MSKEDIKIDNEQVRLWKKDMEECKRILKSLNERVKRWINND